MILVVIDLDGFEQMAVTEWKPKCKSNWIVQEQAVSNLFR